MNINIKGSGKYILENGVLRKKDGSSFEAEMVSGNLEVSSVGSSNEMNINIGGKSINIGSSNGGISVNGNTILINGVSISLRDRKLIVKGNVNEIEVNDKIYKIDSSSQEEDSGIKEYIIQKEITGISIFGSADLYTKDQENFSKLLNLNIKGSGDLYIENYNGENCMAMIMGSGDILFKNVSIKNINATVMGSGDINSRNSSFENVNKTTIGNGDINL